MSNTTGFYNRTIRSISVLLLTTAMVSVAVAASWNTGGGRKKAASSSSVVTNLRDMPLSMRQGFQYKGGLSFTRQGTGGISMGTSSVYYQKGNVLYVIPHKQKVFFQKFKTPQQELK
ncbi:MAG TPA: hypothetical protein PKE63_01455 [Lacibacter sp.]|nr:hypothetical protein [Lacibacter sp.]HMO89371.1 hypothetical protein [Lacibacter sp.]HMP85909.1 hypothetical protein [Lacibacter sp.]